MELKDAKARVFVASGQASGWRRHLGSCHVKCMLIDRRTVFTGSANWTNASVFNLELSFRSVGPPVAEVCQVFAGLWLSGAIAEL